MKKFDTIEEATQDWVREFNAFPQSMLKMICDATGYDTFAEVTTPSIGDRVYEYDNGEYGQIVDYDSEEEIYTIELDNGDICKDFSSSFERDNNSYFPMWGTMWQFGDSCDEYWLEEKDGIRIMSNLGFRIYYNEDWGYFFGIDGAGYDFYTEHWIPLYKARGLHWHKEEEEV